MGRYIGTLIFEMLSIDLWHWLNLIQEKTFLSSDVLDARCPKK